MNCAPLFTTGLVAKAPTDVIRAAPSGPGLDVVCFRLEGGETVETLRAPIRGRTD